MRAPRVAPTDAGEAPPKAVAGGLSKLFRTTLIMIPIGVLGNIVFSLLVLAVLIPGAVVGLIGITIAVFAHEASELIAIANGLRVARRIN